MQDRNLTEGLEISSALSSGSYRKVKYKRMRVSRSGMLIVHNLLWMKVYIASSLWNIFSLCRSFLLFLCKLYHITMHYVGIGSGSRARVQPHTFAMSQCLLSRRAQLPPRWPLKLKTRNGFDTRTVRSLRV